MAARVQGGQQDQPLVRGPDHHHVRGTGHGSPVWGSLAGVTTSTGDLSAVSTGSAISAAAIASANPAPVSCSASRALARSQCRFFSVHGGLAGVSGWRTRRWVTMRTGRAVSLRRG